MPVTRLSRLANFGGTMMWFLAWLCVTGSVLEGYCHSCWRGRSFNDTGQWVQPPHVTWWWCWYVQDVNTNKHIKHKSWKVTKKGETTCTHTVHAQERVTSIPVRCQNRESMLSKIALSQAECERYSMIVCKLEREELEKKSVWADCDCVNLVRPHCLLSQSAKS